MMLASDSFLAALVLLALLLLALLSRSPIVN